MIDVAGEWNPKQAELNQLVRKADTFDQAIALCLEMHALVHSSEMSGSQTVTYEDQVWEGLSEVTFRTMPSPKDTTIAWNLWHLTRIEDMTANILINGGAQVLHGEAWQARMNTDICDTGNAMGKTEIKAFSEKINRSALRDYRIAVGKRTQEILRQLNPGDLKKKVQKERLQRIADEGGVVEEARWLLDFWGRKTLGGLLLMPITRHQIVHLNDALKIKRKLMK